MMCLVWGVHAVLLVYIVVHLIYYRFFTKYP